MIKSPTTFSTMFLISLLALSLSACFQDQTSKAAKGSSDSASKSLITATDFPGALSAVNTVTGIKVVWSPSTVTASAYRVYRVAGANLVLLTSLSPNISSYIDGSVTWGSVYTYTVRAVDSKGVEDANTVQVSSLAWAGIASVTAAGRTAITVSFSSATPTADEVRIYVQGDASETATQTVVSGSTISKTITGLREGFTYKVSAQAYVSSLKKEDGNTVTWSTTTMTTGYDYDPLTASSPAWMSVTNVRAFGAAPGAAIHPTTPNKTPRTNLVELSFKSFNGFGSTAKYVVTRAAQGYPLDTATTTACSSTVATACRVVCSPITATAELTGSGVLHCRDEQVGGAPTRYRYTMSLVRTSGALTWVEPLTEANLEAFSVLVPMPPDNMVLAQRDAVNYEMCSQQMNLTPDPLNHNRCGYTGIGAIPYNTGPNKPPLNMTGGYYDFGYNLFVDRYEQACKWTSQADGGKCGPGQSDGNCIDALPSSTPPDNSIGKEGDVFQALWPGSSSTNADGRQGCYYKYNNAWVHSSSVLTTVPNGLSVLASMYTSDPSTNGGFVAALNESASQYKAWSICNGKSDANYGAKRLPRMREFRAYSGFSTVPNDLYYLTYSQANSYSAGGAIFNSTNGLRCATNINPTTYTPMTAVSSIATLLANTTNEFMGYFDGSRFYNRTFKLGALAHADCQGRYGIQNVQNRSSWTWTSDNTNMNTTTKIMTGTASMLDNGNLDLLSDLSGTSTGYAINYTTATPNGTSNHMFNLYPTTLVSFVAVPLGLPILSSSITGYTSVSTFPEHYGGRIYFPYATGSTTPRGIGVSGRWETNPNQGALTDSRDGTFRCVMEAE